MGVLGDLDKSALMRILTEPKNALIRQYQRLFEFENVRLRFTDDALETVADLALQRKVGARGLRMILEDLMLELMYHLPAQRKLREFVVTADMVRRPRNQLEPAGKSGIITDELENVETKLDSMFNREKLEVKRVPMMPVRDMVIFPQMMQPFIVGREASVRALEEALAGDKKIFLATQHDASVDDPKPEEIFTVGTLANIVQSVKLPDGNIACWSKALSAPRSCRSPAKKASTAPPCGWFPSKPSLRRRSSRPSSRVNGLFEQYVKLSQSLNYDTMIAAARVEDPGKLSDTIAANLQIPVEEKQELLENFDVLDRLNRVAEILEGEIEKLNVDRTINSRVKRQMERAQKEYYLNEKLKAIHKELGRGEKSELDELKKKIETAGMPKDRRKRPCRS